MVGTIARSIMGVVFLVAAAYTVGWVMVTNGTFSAFVVTLCWYGLGKVLSALFQR